MHTAFLARSDALSVSLLKHRARTTKGVQWKSDPFYTLLKVAELRVRVGSEFSYAYAYLINFPDDLPMLGVGTNDKYVMVVRIRQKRGAETFAW